MRNPFEEAATAGDLGTALVGGAVGYTISFMIGFADAGTIGTLSATGALGLKKWVDAGLGRRRRRETITGTKSKIPDIEAQLKKDRPDLAKSLNAAVELNQQGILSDEKLVELIDKLLRDYLEGDEGDEA